MSELKSSNLVARLRAWNGNSFGPYRSPVSDLLEAADEIERLNKLVSEHCQAAFEMGAAWGTQSKEIKRLRAALADMVILATFGEQCSSCGKYIAIDGHREDCSAATAQRLLSRTADETTVDPDDAPDVSDKMSEFAAKVTRDAQRYHWLQGNCAHVLIGMLSHHGDSLADLSPERLDTVVDRAMNAENGS